MKCVNHLIKGTITDAYNWHAPDCVTSEKPDSFGYVVAQPDISNPDP